MTRPLRGANGRFAGSIGNGKTRVPRTSVIPVNSEAATTAIGREEAVIDATYKAYMDKLTGPRDVEQYESSREKRKAAYRGEMLLSGLLTGRGQYYGWVYDEMPLGPLAGATVYGRNLNFKFQGKAHSVGCTFHEDIDPYVTEYLRLDEFLERHRKALESLYCYSNSHGVCSKCSGVSAHPFTPEQAEYLDFISSIKNSARLGCIIEEEVEDELPQKMHEWLSSRIWR
jgi:hypothetical protein